MATMKIDGSPSSFSLTAQWIVYNDNYGDPYYHQKPDTLTQPVNFNVSLPTGAKVVHAYIHSEWGSVNTGYAVKTVNGVQPDASGNVPVTLSTTNGAVSYDFKFRPNATLSGAGTFSSRADVKNIYLHVEYTNPVSSFTTSVSSVDAGGEIIADIKASNTSYTHRMTVQFGSRSASVDGTNTSASFTIPLGWLDQIPDSTSGKATVTIETISGSTVIGTSSSEVTITCPDDIVPTVGAIAATVVDANQNQHYIQNQSRCQIDVTGSQPGTGAKLKSVCISGGGDVVYDNTMLSSILSTAGTIVYTVTVTDTRGRSASDTVSIEVLTHEPIKITGKVAYRCTSDGKADPTSGKSLKLGCTYEISSVSGLDTVASVHVFWREYGDEEWNEFSNWPDDSGNEQIVLIDQVELDKRYEIRFLVTDSISRTEQIVIIPTGSVFMTWNKSKNSFGFGTYPTQEKSVVIDETWSFMIGDKTIRDIIEEILTEKGII